MKIKAALFDVDGVLLDSLTPHLKICEDKSQEYGLGLRIPSASEFKEMVRTGTRISPMKYFFLAVGFPDEFAERANFQYQQIFMKAYAPAPFPRLRPMLAALHDAGIRMGIVTSNVRANVVEALSGNISFFQPDCIFSKESGVSKSQAIKSAVRKLGSAPAETIYIGDQPADWQAAKDAGVNFLGVTYGWGFSEQDGGFPTVGDVPGISRYILECPAGACHKIARTN
jgi:phosphoglycolate phosphatase